MYPSNATSLNLAKPSSRNLQINLEKELMPPRDKAMAVVTPIINRIMMLEVTKGAMKRGEAGTISEAKPDVVTSRNSPSILAANTNRGRTPELDVRYLYHDLIPV